GRRRYLTMHLAWILLCSVYAVYLMGSYFEPGRQICAIPSVFHHQAADRWIQFICLLNLATFVTYCFVAAVASRKAGVSPAIRRAFRCIFIVMIFDVGGWTATVGSLAITFSLNITEENRLILVYADGLFVNFGVAAKPAIYYSISSDYRQAFRILFGRVPAFKLAGATSTISDTTRHSFYA
ncbi:hypothetical protein PRIPAC_77652, partial [Pristionchus pacificus]